MIKTKKLKRNWGEEDLKILVWVVSKYCDLKNIDDVEKDIVIFILFRIMRIGNALPQLSQVSRLSLACSNG